MGVEGDSFGRSRSESLTPTLFVFAPFLHLLPLGAGQGKGWQMALCCGVGEEERAEKSSNTHRGLLPVSDTCVPSVFVSPCEDLAWSFTFLF